MKIKLVLTDWQKGGKSIYNTEDGLILSTGDFHSGTIFHGEIELTPEQRDEFDAASDNGYEPVFAVIKSHKNQA